ncbi:MAG: hypothetical protein ACK4UZ_02660 [Rhizobium rhizophilum]
MPSTSMLSAVMLVPPVAKEALIFLSKSCPSSASAGPVNAQSAAPASRIRVERYKVMTRSSVAVGRAWRAQKVGDIYKGD